MSKKMTPCEKLGYKVGDKFTVIKDSLLEKGTIVVLSEDDGSEVPWFTCGNVRRALIIGSDSDVEPVAKLKPAKQTLADAIHQNGGWPIGVHWLFSTSSRVGAISFWVCRPKFNSTDWFEGGARCVTIMLNRGLPNWHQTILSREEYYQAYQKEITEQDVIDKAKSVAEAEAFMGNEKSPNADDDGWIEWSGGECPVEIGKLVDVKYRDGRVNLHVKAGSYDRTGSIKSASATCWGSINCGSDITAYRHHKPEVKPEFCESVMRSIPEPEAKPTIEKLAQDYRNKLDFAKRKQQEADDAKVAADAALSELERAGEEIGLLLSPIREGKKPEINIIDWRDLMVGDEIICSEDGNWNCDLAGNVCVVREIESQEYTGCMPILAEYCDASDWGDKFTFVRRP